MEQNRLKSWALWLSIAGALWVILSSFGITELLGVDKTVWDTVLNAVGSILMVFGIVNNPTDKASI